MGDGHRQMTSRPAPLSRETLRSTNKPIGLGSIVEPPIHRSLYSCGVLKRYPRDATGAPSHSATPFPRQRVSRRHTCASCVICVNICELSFGDEPPEGDSVSAVVGQINFTKYTRWSKSCGLEHDMIYYCFSHQVAFFFVAHAMYKTSCFLDDKMSVTSQILSDGRGNRV